MAKTQDIKRRIRSIRNTMQLTRAMKMVSASKLRKAQARILAARPYSQQTYRLLRSLSARANPEISPLLMRHGDRRIELLVITGDKGLCGSFNASILRQAESFARGLQGKQISIAAIGKRGRDFFTRRKYDVGNEWIDVLRVVEFPLAAEIASHVIDHYVGEKIDEIYLIYNEFKSAIQARPVVERLLPVEPIELKEGQVAEDYIYEPNPQTLLDALLPHYVEQLVFHALLESVAAEHAARMTAMDAATNNAGEMIESLTLTMNRVRQASITTEIIEVVSGAEALN